MDQIKDEQLIAYYLNGQENALELLIKRYLRPIYSFVYRLVGNAQESEDITQEVFVRAWRNLKKFDQRKSFKTWLFSIAKNASIDSLRKKKAIPFSNFETDKGENLLTKNLVDGTSLPDVIFEKVELGQTLAKVMEKIAPSYRIILFLRYNDHFTFSEIAAALGEPLNTVKSRHRRALLILKKILS